MQVRRIKVIGVALAMVAAGLIGTTPSFANCAAGDVFQGFAGGAFANCGTNPQTFGWQHQRAVQRIVCANCTTNGIAGVDSGGQSGLADAIISDDGTGRYTANYSWGNFGPDGCILIASEPTVSACTGTATTPGVNNFVIAGQDTTFPNLARAAVLSVDLNEPFQFWVLDQAGAASVDGDPCVGDASSFIVGDVECGVIPYPAIALSAGAPGGSTLTFHVDPLADTFPILTDCEVAHDKATNCLGPADDKRNLLVGRQLLFRRDSCTATPADRRSYNIPPSPTSGTLNATRVWTPYAPQDLNLNGVQDGAEVAFVPVTFAGRDELSDTLPDSKDVFVPFQSGASDCVYFAIALQLDVNVIAPGERVLSPLVSINPIPVSADQATPVSDRVVNLVASKSAGKASVSWDTTAEFATSGFNLIGTKKNGGSVQLNSTLIAAKKGTTGEGASYTVSLSSGSLKGSTAVYVEVVKTNGAKERFGPASF